jgi:hypothetical protein
MKSDELRKANMSAMNRRDLLKLVGAGVVAGAVGVQEVEVTPVEAAPVDNVIRDSDGNVVYNIPAFYDPEMTELRALVKYMNVLHGGVK